MDSKQKSLSGWLQGSPLIPSTDDSPATLSNPQSAPTFTTNTSLCDEMVLAMSYVKMQQWKQVYEAETALNRGTLFPELDLPFVGEGACLDD